MVTACIVTILAVMIFKLPNGFLAVFYALAISRGDQRSTVRNGFAIVVGNLAGLALALAGIVLFIDYPLLRFLFLAGTFFLAFFLIRTLTNYSLAFGFSIIFGCSFLGKYYLGSAQPAQAGYWHYSLDFIRNDTGPVGDRSQTGFSRLP